MLVEKDRRVAGYLDGGGDVAFQLGVVADDLHRAAAEDEGGADDEGVADILGDGEGLVPAAGGAVVRLLEAKLVEELLEPLTVFGKVDGVGRGAEDRDAFGVQRVGEFQWGLAAELDDDAVKGAVFLLHPQDFEDVFQGQGFEIEAVGGVVVGADSLRVAVDHDGFIARGGQRIAGVDAAIVELDPLADAVRAAAKDDDLPGLGGAGFAFHVAHRRVFVGGIHVGGLRLELGGAGVDALEDGGDAEAGASAADLGFVAAGELGEAGVGEAHHLQLAQGIGGWWAGRLCGWCASSVDDLADAGQEPGSKAVIWLISSSVRSRGAWLAR